MSAEENKRTVQSIFEAFGRGDIPGVLGHLSEDVTWKAPGPEVIPYFGDRRGHAGATEFFVQLGTNVDFEHFEPGAFVAEGDKVVVLAMFGELGKSELDLHELFEAGGNDPGARVAVFQDVEWLVERGLLEERGNDFYALT